MTKKNDKSKQALEELYANQASIEPRSDLDRMIRARAEQAVRHEVRAKPIGWMSGFATAAVLVVVVAVVIQTPQPEPDLPFTESTTESNVESAVEPTAQRSIASPVGDDTYARLDLRDAEPGSVSAPALQTSENVEEGLGKANPSSGRARESDAQSSYSELVPSQALPRPVRNQRMAVPSERLSPWLALDQAIERGDQAVAQDLLELLRTEFPGDERLQDLQRRVDELGNP